MGNVTTDRWLGGMGAVITMAALLATLPGGIPAAPTWSGDEAWVARIREDRPRLATGSPLPGRLLGEEATHRAPAPLGEVAPGRAASTPPLPQVVAVANNARAMLAISIEPAFAAATGIDLTFAPCSQREALDLLSTGRASMALVGGELTAGDLATGLHQVCLGVELFALAVPGDFPLESLSRAQMRRALTGEVTDWTQLGCDRGAIVVVAPSQEDVAGRAAATLIAGDRLAHAAVRVADRRHVADQLLRNPGAVAIVRVGEALPTGSRLLQIDWAQPTLSAFRSQRYPYGISLQLVTGHVPSRLATQFERFAATEDGREQLCRSRLLR